MRGACSTRSRTWSAAAERRRADRRARSSSTRWRRTLRRFDKGGEQFYDQISALHKSVRGSDPDAALYWLVRMLDGGADPLYVGAPPGAHGGRGHRPRRSARAAPGARRLRDLRAPRLARRRARAGRGGALSRGGAEDRTPSTTPTTRRARSSREDGTRPVPLHLRNAPTRLMKDLGYGKGYRYAHDEADAYAAGENYFPEGMPRGRVVPADRARARRRRSARSSSNCATDATPKQRNETAMIDIQSAAQRPRTAVAKRLRHARRRRVRRRRSSSARGDAQGDADRGRRSCRPRATRSSKQIGQAKAKGEDARAADAQGRRS